MPLFRKSEHRGFTIKYYHDRVEVWDGKIKLCPFTTGWDAVKFIDGLFGEPIEQVKHAN
jgi:hypothetical protein